MDRRLLCSVAIIIFAAVFVVFTRIEYRKSKDNPEGELSADDFDILE